MRVVFDYEKDIKTFLSGGARCYDVCFPLGAFPSLLPSLLLLLFHPLRVTQEEGEAASGAAGILPRFPAVSPRLGAGQDREKLGSESDRKEEASVHRSIWEKRRRGEVPKCPSCA